MTKGLPLLKSIVLLDNTNSFYYCGKVRVVGSAISSIKTTYSGPFSLVSLHHHDSTVESSFERR